MIGGNYMIEIIKAARTNLANQIKKMITDPQPIHISALDGQLSWYLLK